MLTTSPKEQHISQNSKDGKEAILTGNGNSITIAMVSTEQAEVGSLDYKLAIVPVKIKACNGSNIIQTNAFLDPGSSATFCTENLMEVCI